jgi:hypothetical protein
MLRNGDVDAYNIALSIENEDAMHGMILVSKEKYARLKQYKRMYEELQD